MTHYDITGVLRELWDVYSRHIVLYENCEHCTVYKYIVVMTIIIIIIIIIKATGFLIELKSSRPYTVHSFISCIRLSIVSRQCAHAAVGMRLCLSICIPHKCRCGAVVSRQSGFVTFLQLPKNVCVAHQHWCSRFSEWCHLAHHACAV